MIFEFTKEALSYVIPVLSVILSYMLGRLGSKMSDKKSNLTKRYYELYVPYIQRMYAGILWEQDPCNLSFNARSVFFDMLTKNIQYLDKETQSKIPDYYASFLAMLEYESGNPNYFDAPAKYSSSFWSITKCVISEASRLSKKLGLPDITTTLSAKLSECGRL